MSDDTITIRVNKEEREQIERIKAFLGLNGQYGADTSTLKACLNFTENVTHKLFGNKMAQLFYKKKPSSVVTDFKRDEELGHWQG